MTIDLRPETVEVCRERDGCAAEDDRSEAITEALESPQLGYGEGEPLAADSYAYYPDRAGLSNPDRGDFLCRLLGHDKVGGLDDAVAELCGADDRGTLSDWLATLEAATEVHGLDVASLTSEGGGQGDEDTLTAVLGYEPPTAVVHRDNPVLIGELYTAGLSVTEIADTLGPKVEGAVSEGHVRDTLKTVGLIDGPTRDQQREAFAEKDGRIGGTTIDNTDESGGLTIDANDF